MKRLRILAIILVSAFLFAACQREGETSMSEEISMTWELVIDSAKNQIIHWLFKPYK